MVITLDKLIEGLGYVDIVGGPINKLEDVQRDIDKAHKKKCEDIILISQRLADNRYYVRLYVKKEDFEAKY